MSFMDAQQLVCGFKGKYEYPFDLLTILFNTVIIEMEDTLCYKLFIQLIEIGIFITNWGDNTPQHS